ncbi:hypothetical protein [Priestia megaterium]|uniref:hypothetical protein n=1 Tax=Priestia megaterium TaxID=1404 RepID=UPI0015F25120|nr:hypothetical protein [Priestia megaterium]
MNKKRLSKVTGSAIGFFIAKIIVVLHRTESEQNKIMKYVALPLYQDIKEKENIYEDL